MFLLRFLILLLLPVLAYYGLWKATRRFSLTRKQFNLLAVFAVVLVVVLGLIVTGRVPVHFIMAPVMVALTFLFRNLPLLFRVLPMLGFLKNRMGGAASAGGNGGPGRSSGDSSTIRTEWFTMQLDHDSGEMDGQVLKGGYEGRQLSSLTVPELMELARDCRGDHDSIQVLEAYLDRSHPDWRDDYEEQGQGSSEGSGGAGTGAGESEMNESLALEILGLEPGATKKDVKKAHRELMQKLHPDRGGSDYLAQKINAARTYLLDRL